MIKEMTDIQPAFRILDFPSRRDARGAAARTGDAHDVYSQLDSVLELLGNRKDWSYGIGDARFINGYAVVVASLRIAGFTRDGIGVVPADSGFAIEVAEQKALSDAVSKFAGRFPEVRDADVVSGDQETPKPDSVCPSARSLRDLISYSQLSRAKELAGRLSVNADEEAGSLFGCYLTELSRRAADEFIELLEFRVSGPEIVRQAG